MNKILIYGAYGYTGRLIVDEAIFYGYKPTLAGRDEEKIETLASEKGLPAIALSLDNNDELTEVLVHHDLVIHCAGPFIHTAKQMALACLEAKTHYIDITGEFQVFELLQSMNERAIEAGIMLLPGAGFDVVPSDCLSSHLKSKVPNADKLTLAFTGLGGGLSRGTAKTMIENAHEGQWFRKNGKLETRPGGESVKTINYGEFEQVSVGISWGDISSAYFSTKIPNIEVFVGSTKRQIGQMKWLSRLSFLLRLRVVKSFLKKQIDKKPAGPSADRRENGLMHLWGKVENGNGSVEARLVTPNGYTLTAKTALLIANKIVKGDFKAGYQTPSSAYCPDLILEVDGTSLID